jgi:hypothetical protein
MAPWVIHSVRSLCSLLAVLAECADMDFYCLHNGLVAWLAFSFSSSAEDQSCCFIRAIGRDGARDSAQITRTNKSRYFRPILAK